MLKEIGRHLLTQFCAHFQSDLAEKSILLPAEETPDEEYFQSLATMLKSPAPLPDSFKEALFEIEQWSRPESSGILKEMLAKAGLETIATDGACHERLALQLWLARPALLLEDQNRKKHLTPFEGFASAGPNPIHPVFPAPTRSSLEDMSSRMHAWFKRRNPDAAKVMVEHYLNHPGEYWFVIRLGDTCRWIYNLQTEKAELIHFRPDDEDAVLYLAETGQLWITARAKEEREMYRQQLGLFLQGDPDYFRHCCEFCLDLLRTEGGDSLDSARLAGIKAIRFSHDEVDWGGAGHELTINQAEDLFQSAKEIGSETTTFIPKSGRLTRARFGIQFATNAKCRVVEIRPPAILKLESASDLPAVVRWLQKSAFLQFQPQTTHDHSQAA